MSRVPILQYALLSKEYYENAYNGGKPMTDQELLDRMDEFEMTFFLEKGKWIGLQLDILEWRKVIYDYPLD